MSKLLVVVVLFLMSGFNRAMDRFDNREMIEMREEAVQELGVPSVEYLGKLSPNALEKLIYNDSLILSPTTFNYLMNLRVRLWSEKVEAPLSTHDHHTLKKIVDHLEKSDAYKKERSIKVTKLPPFF